MAAKVKASAKSKEKNVPSAELIVARFQQMRAEQRAIVGKITEVEADRNEHRHVSPSQDLVLCVYMCNVYICAMCVCVSVCVCVCCFSWLDSS